MASSFGQPPGPPPGGGGFGQPPGGGGFGAPPGPPPGGGGFGAPPGPPPGGGGFGQPPGGGFGAPPPGGFGAPPPGGGFGAPQPGGFGPGAPPPADYKNAGIFMLISSIANILASCAWVFALIWICVGIFWFLPLAAAIFELIVAIAVMKPQPHQHAKTAAILGLVAGVLTGNIISIGCEIAALVMMGKPEVTAWLDSQPRT